jgi:hypothetical protein
MPVRLTKDQARAFRRRWELVAAAEREELRNTSPEIRFRQLAALFATAQSLGWDEALREGEEEVRERWKKLRASFGVS